MFAMGWLTRLALLIGLGLGPTIDRFLAVDPSAIAQAAGGTALIVVGMGALGFAMSKDLARWMRPLSIIVFAAASASSLVFGGIGAQPGSQPGDLGVRRC